METELNRIRGGSGRAVDGADGGVDGNACDTSWIATHVLKTISSDGRMRRWQWEIGRASQSPIVGLLN